MKIRRLNENYKCYEYHKELDYDMYMIDYLATSYQLWCEVEGLEQMSADEHDPDNLTEEQQK